MLHSASQECPELVVRQTSHAQLFFISVFSPEGKSCIIAVAADSIMGNQFVGQPVQTQGQIEIGPVFADMRIIPSQSITVRITAAAKIGSLAFRIAKPDTLIVILLHTFYTGLQRGIAHYDG